MLILGIDPGLRVTGYGLVALSAGRPSLREAGVLRMKAKGDLATRLLELYTSLTALIDDLAPSHVAVEQLFAHYKHPRTAILMGHARGAIFLAAAQHKVPVVSYNATRIKKTVTGSGRASKDQVQRTIQRELGLAQLPEPSDVADALAAALCHYYLQRRPTEETA